MRSRFLINRFVHEDHVASWRMRFCRVVSVTSALHRGRRTRRVRPLSRRGEAGVSCRHSSPTPGHMPTRPRLWPMTRMATCSSPSGSVSASRAGCWVAPRPTQRRRSNPFANSSQELHRRAITVPSWADVRANYDSRIRTRLDALMERLPDEASGKLILWRGPPGSGKTWALRALVREWRSVRGSRGC